MQLFISVSLFMDACEKMSDLFWCRYLVGHNFSQAQCSRCCCPSTQRCLLLSVKVISQRQLVKCLEDLYGIVTVTSRWQVDEDFVYKNGSEQGPDHSKVKRLNAPYL